MVKVTLIHFWKEDSEFEVCEQTREFNLQEHELYIIEYQYPRYSPHVIVKRAESILKQKENREIFNSYDFLTENCEDCAIWCVLGEERSLQADTFFNCIIQILWSIFGGSYLIASLLNKVTNVPLVVLGICSAASIIYCIYRTVRLYRIKQYRNYEKVSSDFLNAKLLDLWQQFGAFSLTEVILIAIVNYAMPNVPLVILGTCFAASIYCFIKSVYLIKRYRNDKKICWHCLNEKLLDLWLQLQAFGLTSAISFAIVNFALPLQIPVIAIPIAVGVVLGGTALTLFVPRIRKALWSPVQYSEKEIKTLSEMKLGDVASLTYRGFRHLVVVSEVKWDDDPKQGTIRGIHYSLPSLFGTREIVEEILQVDLKRSKVNIVQFNTLFTFSPGEVMDRARKRIGERKWNMSSNISDHLCQWAKVKSGYNFEETECLEDEETRNTHSSSLSSLLVGKADVHLMNEIQLGDVVEYGSDKGIVVRLEDVKDGRVFDMHVVIRKSCFDYRGRQVLDRIDLNKDNLVVHRYHPVHCVNRRERVEKAQSMIGKTIQCWMQFGFIENIILRPRENK